MDAATKFIGGAIGRRVKRAYEERVVQAVSAKQDAMLREQIAIAERYPELRACLTNNVVFLAGGNRVVPMSSLSRGFTLEQQRRRGPATERLIRAPRPAAARAPGIRLPVPPPSPRPARSRQWAGRGGARPRPARR